MLLVRVALNTSPVTGRFQRELEGIAGHCRIDRGGGNHTGYAVDGSHLATPCNRCRGGRTAFLDQAHVELVHHAVQDGEAKTKIIALSLQVYRTFDALRCISFLEKGIFGIVEFSTYSYGLLVSGLILYCVIL